MVTATLAALLLLGCTPNGPAVPEPATPTPSQASGAPVASSPPGTNNQPRPTPRAPAPVGWANAHGFRVQQLAWRLPTPSSRQVVFAGSSSLVVAGGLGPGDVSRRQVVEVDAVSGRPRALPPLPQPVHDAAGTTLAGRLVVFGGGGQSELSDVARARPRGRWSVSGKLPAARSDLSVVPVASGALLVGGYDGRTSNRSVLQTTDGRSFSRVAQLRHGVRYAAVATDAHGIVWVIGGEDNGSQLRTIQRLDPRSGTTTDVGRWPVGLGHAAAVAVGPRILVLGGRTARTSVTDRLWWFDPATGRVSSAGHLPYAVADAGLLVTDQAAYLVGGEGPAFRRTVLRLSPVG